MRPRHSIAGPLILITLGILFLVHTTAPDFRIGPFVSAYWPYFLIIWGVIQLIEIAVIAIRSREFVPGSLGGGSWVIVAIICILGLGFHEVESPNAWWHQFGFDSGLAVLGPQHEFSIVPIERPAGSMPHVVIESFRGDAKITAADGPNVTVTGHKIIHAFDNGEAERGNAETPVEVLLQGNTVVIRCNQGRIPHRQTLSTDLEISVPRGASLEATGTSGDFDVSGLNGDVDLSSGHADVRAANLKGSLHVDIGKSSEIRCSSIEGGVVVRGRGGDISLSDITGSVDVNGDYSGLIALTHIGKSVRLASMRTEFDAAHVPGEVKLARGSLDGNGLAGPLKVVARATDVSLTSFTDALDLSVDKGDIDLRPEHTPLGSMNVRDGAGDIDLALPDGTGIALAADTDRGNIQTDLGLTQQSDGRRSHLEGNVGKGASVTITTRRGDISVHHSGAAAKPSAQIAQTKSDDEE